jgi:hypothetical protein
MQISRNKTKLTTSIVIILLTISAFVVMINAPVQAQDEYENWQEGGSIPLPDGVTPDVTVSPTPYLSFRPNPVGVNQPLLVNMWVEPGLNPNWYHTRYKVTITKPDETTEVKTMNSYPADATAWFEYIPDQVGTYTLKFDFPGGYFPAGTYKNYYSFGQPQQTYTKSYYFEPSSTAERSLTVQEDMVYSWPESPLPTDYWTRPVSPENREWWSILGDYPWSGPGGGSGWPADTSIYTSSRNSFTPYVQAPNTAHIVWKRQEAIGGLGGMLGTLSWTSGGGNPDIIFEGRAYKGATAAGGASVWQCFDIRTGEMYWEQQVAMRPTVIEYSVSSRGGPSVSLVYIGANKLLKYDPWSGRVTTDVSIAPLRTGTYYMNGYALSVQNLADGSNRLINWTTLGTTGNFNARIANNVTWPWRGLDILGYGGSQDFDAGIAISLVPADPEDIAGSPPYDMGQAAVFTGLHIYTASLVTGQSLWNKTIDVPNYGLGSQICDHGKLAVVLEDGTIRAFDLETGNLAWKSERMDSPWSSGGFGAYSLRSAYGLLYRNAYDGVYAFDWDTGKIVWHYVDYTNPFETPYTDKNGATVNSFNGVGTLADGKYYTYTTEHSPTQPITRGWGLHCLNATTGELIWKITGSMTPGAIADGYLTASNSYDGYMYVFGKGESATTVTAPDVAVPKGTAITIKGTVLDMSPAQLGTPCISAASMTTQMEYLHMQHPIDGLYHNETITGVTVYLTAIDSDNNVYDLGTVTSNGYYGTFGYAWTPSEEGLYEIIASFMGDDSYGSSVASTYISVTGGITAEEIAQKVLDELPINPSAGDIAGAVINQLPEGITAQNVADKVLDNLPEGPSAEDVAQEIINQLPEEPEEPEAPAYTMIDLAIITAVVVVAALVVYNIYTIRKRK